MAAAECERNLNGRADQASSRLSAPVSARAAARVRGVHARPHMLRLDGRLALARGLLRPSSELSGAGSRGADQLVGRKVERDAAEPGQRGRGWDRERRSRSESPSDGKAGRRGATAVERRAGEQKEAPPRANFRGTLMSYALQRNQFVSRVFTISLGIPPSQNSWGQFCCDGTAVVGLNLIHEFSMYVALTYIPGGGHFY